MGRTRLKFSKKLHGKARIINFSYGKIPPRIKEIITGLGMVVMDNAGLSLHRYEMDKVRNHYMCWARGFKVAVEVILMAIYEDVLKTDQVVIGVGVSAIAAEASSSKEMFGPEVRRRLEVRKIAIILLR